VVLVRMEKINSAKGVNMQEYYIRVKEKMNILHTIKRKEG
jgi:hypothetical protein